MDKHKALEIIYDAAKQARLVYGDHAICQQAYEILKKELTPKEEELIPEKPPKS